MDDDDRMTRVYSNVPIPDPSLITTKQIELAKADLRKEFDATVAYIKSTSNERLEVLQEILRQRDSKWTFETLKEFVDQQLTNLTTKFSEIDNRYQQRFDAQQKAVADALTAAEKAVNAALSAADRAVLKAETSAEKRFESVNEFRGTLSDQAATFLPRSEADARFIAISDKIVNQGEMVTRAEHQVVTDGIAALSTEQKVLASTMVRREDLKSLNDAIDKLRDNVSSTGGQSIATDKNISWAIAGIAVLVSILTFFYNNSHTQSYIPPPPPPYSYQAPSVPAIIPPGGVPLATPLK